MLAKTFMLSLFLTLTPAAFQSDVDVPIIQEFHSRRCMLRGEEPGVVVSQEELKKFSSSEAARDCGQMKELKVDFAKQSLLAYTVRGDCFVRGSAKLTRNDELRKYTLAVTRVWGGCRAAGSFQGWLVVDKLREGYTVEQVLIKGMDD